MPRARKVTNALIVAPAAADPRDPEDGAGRNLAKPDRGGSGPLVRPGLDVSPIFVHSSFRTSSTWFWGKLRATPHTTAYYEIFNEGLAGLDVLQLSRLDYRLWDSRHPSGAPYFLEFLPLLQEGGGIPGIPGFSEHMALDSFLPPEGLDGMLPEAEHNYVGRLIANAHASGTIPVLSCTRSLGRARALRKAFGGRTVFCHRNLFHQWASYAGQAMTGNPYFLSKLDLTLKATRQDPFLAAVDAWTADRTIAPTDEKLFQAFLLLHLYLSAQAYEDSDLLVDVTALARDPALQRKVEAELGSMVGAPVDLSDARLTFDASPLAVPSMRDVAETISQFTKMIRATCRSAEAGAFVESLKDAALSEWERHEFYVHKLRAVQGANLARAERHTQQVADRAQAAEAERDALAAQAAGASAEAAALREAIDGLQQAHSHHGEALTGLAEAHVAESEALRARASAAEVAAIAHLERATAAEAERDQATQERFAAQSAAAEAQAALDAMRGAYDAQAHRLSEVEAALSQQAAHAGVIEAERASQAARATTAEAERDRVTDDLRAANAVTAELQAAVAAFRENHEAQAQRSSALEAALSGQVERATAAVAERDRLDTELLTASARIADLHAALTAATQERDVLAQRLAAPPARFAGRLRRMLG